jgi:hypothetical protein
VQVQSTTDLSEAEALQAHHQRLFGPAVSDSTTRRTVAALDTGVTSGIARVRARVRRHVWSLLELRPGGFPWLTVAGKHLHRWVVIDMDATITTAEEKAIATLPETAWETSLKQDGTLQEGYFVAELTGLNTRPDWIKGMRLIVRRVKPSGRHPEDLTAFEKKTGWKYSITATNISKMTASPDPTRRNGSTPSPATTPWSRTGCARTRPSASTTSPRSPGS